jgi:hypothetical protein
MIFRGLGLKVKMQYTGLWKVMPWCKSSQHCTPYHWATYYLMTLYNMGAFTTDELEKMDPDSPATRSDVAHWFQAVMEKSAGAHPLLEEQAKKEAGPISRGELAELTLQVAGRSLEKRAQ